MRRVSRHPRRHFATDKRPALQLDADVAGLGVEVEGSRAALPADARPLRPAERRALVAAETERKEAEERAAAARITTESEAARTRAIAAADADAETVLANAAKLRAEIEAAAQRAMNEADNLLSVEQVGMKVKLAIVDRLQEIIRESVRPMERIEGIKILQVDGLNGGARGSGGSRAEPGGTNENLAEQVVASALRYRAQAPVVDALLQELGFSAADPHGLTALVRKQVESGILKRDDEDDDGSVD